MAVVGITIPDALVPRLRAAMRGTFPEEQALDDVAAFQEITAAYWRGILAAWEGKQAEAAAWAASRAAVEAAHANAVKDGAGIH